MAKNVINKYIWIVDTIQRYGRITREELNDLWVNSSLSDGEELVRRTLYNYRQGIAEMFNIDIANDKSTNEYYIANDCSGQSSQLLNMLLDSASVSGMLSDSASVSDRIILENVPSAREHLPTVMQALKEKKRITFTYRSYTRTNPSYGVTLEPYCVRLFKQLWYVIGFNVKDRKIKTYSLDRMSEVLIGNTDYFEMPDDFDPTTYFNDCFGIMTGHGEAKDIVLRVAPGKAKYFRALPLHHSQKEDIHDKYSIFRFHLFLTNDFISEILSHGADVQVIAPLELRTTVISRLRSALESY